MDNGGSQDMWYKSWLSNKYELFASLIKLRLPKSPKFLLHTIHDSGQLTNSSTTPRSQNLGGTSGDGVANEGKNGYSATQTGQPGNFDNDYSFYASFFDQFNEQFTDDEMLERSTDILMFLNQELIECSNLLFMSEGYFCPSSENATNNQGNTTSNEDNVPNNPQEKFAYKYDVFTFSDDNYYTNLERRFKFALESMQIYGNFDVLRSKSREFWLESLQLAKKWIELRRDKEKNDQKRPKNVEKLTKDEKFSLESTEECEKSLQEILKLIELSYDGLEISEISFEKFRANDDLYILQNGLPGYQDALNRVLTKIGGHEWDMQILEVLEQKAVMIETFEQMRHLVDVLLAASNMVDMRVQKSFNKIFKVAYSHLVFALKKQVMNYYYQKYQLRDLSSLDSDYGTELNLILNNLAEGMTKIKVRQMAVRLSWHFMLSAKQCWWRILNAVVAMPKLVPAIIEVLRFLPAVSNIRLPEVNNERLILAGLTRLLDRNVLTNEEQETAWVDFVVLLCGDAKKPILDPVQLINGFLFPLLPKYPWLLLSALLKIFGKRAIKLVWLDCEQRQNTSSSTTPAENSSIASSEPALDPARIFIDIFNIYVRATRSGHVENMINHEIRNYCPRVLKALTACWRIQGVRLTPLAVEKIKSTFEALPWTQRLLIDFYLRDFQLQQDDSTTAEAPPAGENGDEKYVDPVSPTPFFVSLVPACLCEVLRLPSTKYTPLDCCHDDEDADLWADRPAKISFYATGGPPPKPVCALNALMEAAMLSPELSSVLLNNGTLESFIGIKPLDLKKYLLFSVRVNLEKKNLDQFKSVVKMMSEFFDRFENQRRNLFTASKKADKSSQLLETAFLHGEEAFKEGYRKGMKFIAPVVLLCDAAFTLVRSKETLSKMDKEQQQQDEMVKKYLNNLYAVVCECYTSCCDAFKSDHLALHTSLTQLWNSCCLLLQAFDQSARPRPLEYLLLGFVDAFRRSHVTFQREWVERLAPSLSTEMYENFCRKLEFGSFNK